MKSVRLFNSIQIILVVACLAVIGCNSRSEVKATRRPVTNQYHGVEVVDHYQWLENASDPAVRRWSAAQNKTARAMLDRLPTRPLVEDRLTRLLTNTSANYFSMNWRRGQFFLLKFKPPAQQPVLITLASLTNLNSEKVILDPNELSTNGTTAIDWFVPSLDGKLIALSLSQNGSEEGTLYIYETATGQRRPDIIPRVQAATAGGSAAWNADASGLFYTRYPHKGERQSEDLSFYQQIYFHKLGTPVEQDTYELGNEFPRIAETQLKASPDGRYLLATVANGDGGEYAHYLRQPSGGWRQITRFTDQIKQVEFGRDPVYIEWGKDEALYLLSRNDAPKGKILRLPLAQPDLTNASTIFPAGTNVIQDFKPAASGLCLVFLNGGPMELHFLDYFENTIRSLVEKSSTAVEEMLVTQGDEVVFRSVTFTDPYAWLRYNPNRNKERVESTVLYGKSPVSFGDVEAVRQKAVSKDGTKVPLSIIRKKGLRLDGENPTILTGYGGYGISLTPNFDVSHRVWLDQGGVIAVAHLRGGGEFGEPWHQAGSLTNKQNVFDDFAACAEFLIRSNYTRPSKLAIEGGSNGGLLMGATLAQHPDLMQAVVSHVGIYDMLRVELDPNGAFNVTEFGTVKNRDQFNALYAYSPYHHVMDKTNYPAVLMLTGENDGRVNPAHSRKMTARLQSATGSSRPVLLRTSSSTGHGVGTALSERIQELADVYAFLFEQLGMEYSVIDRGPSSGAITPSSAVIKAKLVREGMVARLVASTSPSLTMPIYSGFLRSETNHGNVVEFPLANLEPATPYYYALEIDGRLDRKKAGEFRTFPASGPASFTIAFASCAKTGSTSDVFDRIRENHPLFYMNMGDFHYLNISTNDRARFRAAYDAVLASPQQADLYRHVPFVYIWDDHDFGGNNSNRKASSHEAARLTYDEYVPHYPLASGEGDVPIYHSFALGRVKFILTDLRSERDDVKKKDNAGKSMMGARQKEWFKKELLEANGKYPLICWVSSVPWIGQAGTNVYHAIKTNQFGFIHHTNLVESVTSRTNRNRAPLDEDDWAVFSTERREIANFIKSNHISGVCILHGDSHMLAADDGTHSDYATGGGAPLPVMCAAPLDQEPSIKGGPYSQGVYRMKKGEGGFGLLTVDDKGDRIEVSYSGRNNKNEEKISLKFTVPASKESVTSGNAGGFK
jgi:prolyl oligopeptidase